MEQELYVRHRGWMLRYAIAITRDDDTAEDAVEIVFLKILRAGLPDGGITEPYLRAAIANECRSARRLKKRCIPIPLSLEDRKIMLRTSRQTWSWRN